MYLTTIINVILWPCEMEVQLSMSILGCLINNIVCPELKTMFVSFTMIKMTRCSFNKVVCTLVLN